MTDRIVVVGGGPAGMMAAGRAAELGANVLLIEKTARLGTKLRLTGGGRCNLSNAKDVRTFLSHILPEGSFLRNAMARFFVPELRDFLGSLGVPTVVEEDDRVFPATHRAHDIATALRGYCLQHGVQMRYSAPVSEIVATQGAVQAVCAGGKQIGARAVILATGGITYPTTGSSGDGFRLAAGVGHHVATPRLGLVPLVVAEPFIERLQGISLSRVALTAQREGRTLARTEGGMLFTHWGISGPAVLNLSSRISEPLRDGPVTVSIDLSPDLAAEALDRAIRQAPASTPDGTPLALVRQYVPRSMAQAILERCDMLRSRRLSQLSATERAQLVRLVKSFDLTVTGTRPESEAMITMGGVDCAEIVPYTMASSVVRGLYMAGEIINVSGDTGGYNLQIAFSTGHLAGESAAREVQRNSPGDRGEP